MLTLDEEKGLVGEGEEGQGVDLDDAEATIVHRVFTYASQKKSFSHFTQRRQG